LFDIKKSFFVVVVVVELPSSYREGRSGKKKISGGIVEMDSWRI